MQPRHQATLTQPLQCVSQHHIANLHVSTHMATPDDNNHAAIPMRSATDRFQNTPITTHTSRTKATRCKPPLQMRQTKKRMKLTASRTRRTQEVPFIAACSHFTLKHKVSCSGFLPKTKPMQHSCSHSNAICNHSFKKHKELRTQEQPLVAKHIEGTNRVRNDRSRPRRAHEVPFIAAWIHFTRKNTRFSAPASSPKNGPCNIHAAIPMRSATTASRNTKNYAHRNNHSLQNT